MCVAVSEKGGLSAPVARIAVASVPEALGPCRPQVLLSTVGWFHLKSPGFTSVS